MISSKNSTFVTVKVLLLYLGCGHVFMCVQTIVSSEVINHMLILTELGSFAHIVLIPIKYRCA